MPEEEGGKRCPPWVERREGDATAEDRGCPPWIREREGEPRADEEGCPPWDRGCAPWGPRPCPPWVFDPHRLLDLIIRVAIGTAVVLGVAKLAELVGWVDLPF